MTKKQTDRSTAGRKSNAEAKDLQSIITKAEWEMRKNDAQCANDLAKLYALQREIAFGIGSLGKQASVTNRKSAIENMIVRGEAYATGDAPLLNPNETPLEDVEDLEVDVVSEKMVSNGEPVLSFQQKRDLWEKQKANKEG